MACKWRDAVIMKGQMERREDEDHLPKQLGYEVIRQDRHPLHCQDYLGGQEPYAPGTTQAKTSPLPQVGCARPASWMCGRTRSTSPPARATPTSGPARSAGELRQECDGQKGERVGLGD